jgi:hypothetical protein
VETVEDGALGWEDAMSGAPLKSLGKRSNSRYPERMPIFSCDYRAVVTWCKWLECDMAYSGVFSRHQSPKVITN